MLDMIKAWKGAVEINGQQYPNIQNAMASFKAVKGEICIKLYPQNETRQESHSGASQPIVAVGNSDEVRITVKKYMTEKATPSFDFMKKWNNDNPMPYRTMTGWAEKETKGMVYMHLHGDIWTERIFTCMCCGRQLTNPVSQYFGIGPECGGHNYTHPFSSDKELKDAVNAYRKQLQSVTWEGWVVKSAITESITVGGESND